MQAVSMNKANNVGNLIEDTVDPSTTQVWNYAGLLNVDFFFSINTNGTVNTFSLSYDFLK